MYDYAEANQRKKEEEQQKMMDNMKAQFEALKNQQAGMTSMDDQGYQRMGGGVNDYGIQKGAFTMLRDKEGNLQDRFKETLDPTLQGLKEKYDVEGDTKWAALKREEMGNQLSGASDQARLNANTGMAQARGSLAMRGGLRGGAGERMAMGNQRGLMSQLQGLGAENRAGGLRLSIADEEMKNKVLGNIGQTGQGIQGRNIGMLQGDIANQNQFESQKYSDDMAAYGAKETAKAQRKASGGCFLVGTEVLLANGDYKNIEDVILADQLFEGGDVYGVMQFISSDMFEYLGVNVTGGHAVKEGDTWLRIADSKHAKRVEGEFLVYNLCTTKHRIVANEVVFADYDETEHGSYISDDDSLEVLNNG